MADLWMPGVTRMPGRGRSLNGGGAHYANWHSTENDPSATAHALASYLIGEHYEPHFVWNPWSGELVQLLPANVGGSVLKSGNVSGSVNIGVEAIGRAGVAGQRPFYDSPMKGFGPLLNFIRSWGVPDTWPAGAPLAYPQSAGYGNPQRAKWGPSGHYGHSQWPSNDHGDPGLTKVEYWTGTAPTEDELKVPTIKYGFDVGHPSMVEMVDAAIDAISPGEKIRTKDADRKQAVIKYFQALSGLDQDGLVGPSTYAKLVEQAANSK